MSAAAKTGPAGLGQGPHAAHGHRGAAHARACGCQGTGRVLTIRSHSGLSGDMLLAGLLRMTDTGQEALDGLLPAILPHMAGSVRLVRRQVQHVGGWFAAVSLPPQHEHRTLAAVTACIAASGLAPEARRLATEAFTLLAGVEAFVHDTQPEHIHFHEVGALDSILDICLSCELFVRLAPSRFVVSPLPVADGSVCCAHGCIPVPAPAVLELLVGVPVRPFAGEGETVTPTAAALLRTLGATFGPWPSMTVEKTALVFGSRVFPHVPNGATFACGTENIQSPAPESGRERHDRAPADPWQDASPGGAT